MFHRFALIVALFVLAMASSTSRSATITVTSTADSGAGSLRAAITTANGTAAADVIAFNIAGSCPRVILLTTPLPTITTEAVLLLCIINAKEERDVAIIDIPNAFIQT